MGIDDIPVQVGRVLRFSIRSKSGFLLSFFSAAFVIGFATDLLYSFAYTRIYDVKDAHYGLVGWCILVTTTLGIPAVAGLYAAGRGWLGVQPFRPGRYGIAIAPFNVHSIDPDVLGTPSKKQGLEDVVAQFFDALRAPLAATLPDEEFAFRALPPFARVTNETQSKARWSSLSASLLIWGTIVQKANQPLMLRVNLTGYDTHLTFSGQLDPIEMSTPFAYYLLTVIGYADMRRGDPDAAVHMFDRAGAFAADLDQLTKSNSSSERLAAWRAEAVQAAAHRRALAGNESYLHEDP